MQMSSFGLENRSKNSHIVNDTFAHSSICYLFYVPSSVADPWHFGVDPDPRDPCLWLMDPNPAIFVIELQYANKN